MYRPSEAFVHLHVHSDHSVLRATCTVDRLAERAAELGQPAIALTDYGTMSGAVDFQRACDREGVRAIHGVELLVDPHLASRPVGPPSLVLLARNDAGLENLFRLSTDACLETGDPARPMADLALLSARAEGVVALTGGRRSELANHILYEQAEAARSHLGGLVSVFGRDGVAVQLEQTGYGFDSIAGMGAIPLAQELDLQLVATGDVHYLVREDFKAWEAAVAIREGSPINKTHVGKNERYLKSSEEMERVFALHPAALEGARALAERCRTTIAAHELRLPRLEDPEHRAGPDRLRALAVEGLARRYGTPTGEGPTRRLQHELELVEKRNLAGYFLVLWDLVRFAKSRGLAVGPGRGPAGGSILNYCLAITDVDPIEHGLWFERFLEPEGGLDPDIDLDFAVEGRGELVAHLQRAYGRESVAHVMTRGRLGPRGAVRKLAPALGYGEETGDALARLIPDPRWGRWLPIGQYLAREPELRARYERDAAAREILDLAEGLRELAHVESIHACAIVVGDRPLAELVPMQPADTGFDPPAKGRVHQATQPGRRSVEWLGLLTLDLLGLRALSLTGAIQARIEHTSGEKLDLAKIKLDEPDVFELLTTGDTDGVFEFESQRMRRTATALRPDRFEDIAALIAMDRPLAADLLPSYGRGKRDPESVDYPAAELTRIFAPTYGVPLYQEQVMATLVELGGFTASEANQARKALGKKQRGQIPRWRDRFFAGAAAHDIAAATVEHIWRHYIEEAIDWAFNKAHAVAYALIAYRLAWLKTRHPLEFLASFESGHEDW